MATTERKPTIVRTPIVGIERTPIIGVEHVPVTGIERTPILEAELEPVEELQWDDVYSSFVNYIKFASKQVSSQSTPGALNSAEDLFQEGQLLLYHCYTLYKHKPLTEFSPLFKASLWRKLREISGRKVFIQVDLEDAYDLGYSENVVEDIYNEYKLQQVASMLEDCPEALTIFKEFVNPSTRTIWEAEMDVARKMTLRDQNYKISVPRTVRIKGVHIQRALEISKGKFNEYFALVKKCVSSVYCPKEQSIADEEIFEERIQACG